MWRNSSVLATRGSCRGNPTTAAQSCRPRQALSITAAWCQQQGGATRVAQLQWHCLAGPGSTVRHVGLAPTARGRCWGNPAMETWSGQPWQAAGAARQRRHQPAGPGLHHPAQRPGANSGEALPGRTSYGSIVWSDLAVAVRRSGLEAAASRHHQDGPAEVAWSGWPHQVLSSMAAPCRRRRCAGRQLDWGSTVWPAPAGANRRGSLVAALSRHFQCCPATAAPAGRPQQALSSAVAPCWWRGGTVRASWLWWHRPAGLGRRCLARHPGATVKGHHRVSQAAATPAGLPW